MHIYIMQRKTKQEKETRFWHLEVKVGISNSPQRRLKEIDKAIPGSIVLLRIWRRPYAQELEQSLHKKYSAYSFVPRRAKEGGGKTEWFRLTRIQYQRLVSDIQGDADLIANTILVALLTDLLLKIVNGLTQ